MDNILNLFFEEPEREFHVREIARIVKKSPTTISKYLTKLQKEQMLTSRTALNHKLFKADTESLNYKNSKLAYNINQIVSSKLIDYIKDKLNPSAIILFGSFRKSENNKESDIDLLVISPEKTKLELSAFERKLKHKIQLFVHSNKDLQKMLKTNKELVNNWINGIVVYGYWEALK